MAHRVLGHRFPEWNERHLQEVRVATIWKGAISFGLVNIPVRAEPATRDTDTVRFRQLDRTNNAPIRMMRVNSVTSDEVPWSDIVKGYEYTKDKFVIVTPEELDALNVPTGRALELLSFVDATEIDPRHYEAPYFLIPESTADRAYALLREAIRDSGVVGVGRVTIRQRTHVVTVRVLDEALVMDIIRPAAELVNPADLHLPSAEGVKPQEKAMAEQLIGHLRAPFDTSAFTDQYQEAVRQLVEAKLAGEELDAGEITEPEGTPVIDLMSRLKESLETVGGSSRRGSKRGGKASARKVTAASKAAHEGGAKAGRAGKRRSA